MKKSEYGDLSAKTKILIVLLSIFLMITSICTFSLTVSATANDITEANNNPLVTTDQATTIILSSPEDVKVTKNKKGNLTISWNEVYGAVLYKVYRISNNDEVTKKEFDTTEKTSVIDKNIKAGNLYVYYVIAMDGVESHNSLESKASYYFEEPKEFSVTNVYTKKKKEKLTWDKVAGASSYVIYKKNAKGDYAKLAQTTKTSYQDSDVKKNDTYTYKVGYQIDLPDGSVLEKQSSPISVYTNTIDPNKKMVALTFDDGPGKYTQEIVNCLKKNDARATFFVLGCNVNSYKSAVKNANKIGCEIANHSYDHTILTRLSASKVKKQMSDTDAKIKKITGKKTTLMRCPGGGVNKTVQGAVGKPIILWSIDTLDWKTRNTDKTISAVMNNVKDGDIVLMHDIHEPTKKAALYLIPQLRKKGYQLVTVSELAEYRGYKLKKGSIYHSFRKKKK